MSSKKEISKYKKNKKKTVPCKFCFDGEGECNIDLNNGECNQFGKKCIFAHNMDELQKYRDIALKKIPEWIKLTSNNPEYLITHGIYEGRTIDNAIKQSAHDREVEDLQVQWQNAPTDMEKRAKQIKQQCQKLREDAMRKEAIQVLPPKPTCPPPPPETSEFSAELLKRRQRFSTEAKRKLWDDLENMDIGCDETNPSKYAAEFSDQHGKEFPVHLINPKTGIYKGMPPNSCAGCWPQPGGGKRKRKTKRKRKSTKRKRITKRKRKSNKRKSLR